jgi:hypothetical protein
MKATIDVVDAAFAEAIRPRPGGDETLIKSLARSLARLNTGTAPAVASYLHKVLGYYPFVDLVEMAANWSECGKKTRTSSLPSCDANTKLSSVKIKTT